MKNKLISFFAILLVLFGINSTITQAQNSNEEFSQKLKQMAETLKITGQTYGKKFAPFYTKLQTCTPYKDDLTEIYGKTNTQCHFRMMGYDCLAPFAVSEYYGVMGANVMNALAVWDENTLESMTQKRKKYEDFENTTIKYYCKLRK